MKKGDGVVATVVRFEFGLKKLNGMQFGIYCVPLAKAITISPLATNLWSGMLYCMRYDIEADK